MRHPRWIALGTTHLVGIGLLDTTDWELYDVVCMPLFAVLGAHYECGDGLHG
jgi:hypothetical protein